MNTDADKIAAVAVEADATIDEQMPAEATSTRPNKVDCRGCSFDARGCGRNRGAGRTNRDACRGPAAHLDHRRSGQQSNITVRAAVERLSADLALLRQLIA
jgi:hypothetical protein